MPRSKGGGSRSRGGSSSGGTSVSTGRTGNVSTGRRGGGSTNVSVGGGRDVSHNTREQRRGNQPDAVAPDLIDVVNAEMDLGLAPGTVSNLMAAGDIAGAQAVTDLAEVRKGVAGLSALGLAGGIATGVKEEQARASLANLGVDLDTALSTKESINLGINVAKEGFGISQAVEAGAGFADVATGVARPFSTIGGAIGRQIGKFGERLSASMTEEQKAAGPSREARAESLRSRTKGGGRDRAESLIGGGEPLEVEPPSSAESLTDTEDRVEMRSRSSVDIRRRTRPAAFIGPGTFNLGIQELTG